MNGLTDPAVALYVAAAVAVMVWLGIFAYLWRIDVQARALRRALEQREREGGASQGAPAAPVRPERIQPERKEPSNV